MARFCARVAGELRFDAFLNEFFKILAYFEVQLQDGSAADLLVGGQNITSSMIWLFAASWKLTRSL